MDVIIETHLHGLIAGSKSVSFDDALADFKRNIRLDASELDARLRTLILQTSSIELCERRGQTFAEKALRAAIKHLNAFLQPACCRRAPVGEKRSQEKHILFCWVSG